jgi:superfamily I DNA/RNA helicase
MDAFDAVRDSAARLHQELIEDGSDPLDPVELVEAAVGRLELYLYRPEPGDPVLKGAHALYDDQSGSIFCEKTEKAGEGAVLVAHELGHARVHAASSSCSTSDVDASQPAEAAPIGLQKVADYGVRERRELQANVFAREFLLPRALSRRLFLDEGMGASDIADRTGLPMGLVRQQLFDALLLPEPPGVRDEGPPAARTPRPDPSQARAAAHRGSAFQLQAGPGTGKTRTLVKTVRSLMDDGVHPSSLLILTYSNRAAGELAERIASSSGGESPVIWIGTFHAFGLDLIRRYHDKLGLPPKPVAFDKSDAIEVLEELLPTLPLVHYRNLWDPAMVLREIVGAISRAKDEMTDPKRYRQLGEEMLRKAGSDRDAQVAAQKCLEVAEVYDHYEKGLRDHGAVDFGDLIMRPALLLESDVSARTEVEFRHRHVLVDEYQDVNRASTRLLRAIAGDGRRLWVVGDARQSIYRFRGASSVNMVAFAGEYPNAKVDQLGVNYRSTQEVVDVVLAIAPRMGASEGMLPLALEADRGRGPAVPEIRRYGTLDDEVAGIAASVRELEGRGVRLRDQAILCRGNDRLSEIAEGLEARGIPVLHLGSLFERDEVRDLLSLMSVVVDAAGDGLTRLAAMPRYQIPLQDLYAATSWLKKSERRALEALPELPKLDGLSAEGASGFARLAGDLEGVGVAVSAWELLATYLLDRTELLRDRARATSVAGVMRALATWQFLNFIREQVPTGSGLPIRRILDRVRHMVSLAEERDLRQVPAAALHMDAVKLMTVHGAKGLEFEAVHVPGLTVSSFPAKSQGQQCPPPAGMMEGSELSVAEEARLAHENEEECLFFVAASRAKSHLRIYLCQKTRDGKNRTSSPFLDWVAGRITTETRNPACIPLPPGAPRAVPIQVAWNPDWHVTDGQLVRYGDCPRRFFYTHVLGLRGSRKSTAFQKTHDCIYELISWLATARKDGAASVEAAEAALESIWNVRGPFDHGFAADYRRIASKLIVALISAGAGHKFLDSVPIAIDFPNGRVVVSPSEIAELPGGAVVLRRVSTGHPSKDESDKIEYALYHLAGQVRFGKRFQVQAVHLSKESVEVVSLTDKKIANKKAKSGSMLEEIAAGQFPPKANSRTCPKCPHFFLCDAMPRGDLKLA